MWWLVGLVACSEFGITGKEEVPADGDTGDPPAPGALLVSPELIDFGEVAVGASADDTITLSNVGEGPLTVTVSGLLDDDGVFVLTPVHPVDLDGGASVEVPVTFAPHIGGEFAGDAWFESDVLGAGTQRVALRGRTPGPDIRITPEVHDFGTVGVGTSQRVTLTVENVGWQPLIVDGVTYDSTDGRYLFLADDGGLAGRSISPGSGRTMEVAFTPEEAGGWEGTVTVASNDPDTPEATAVQSGLAACDCPDEWFPSADLTKCERTVREPALFIGEPMEVCQIDPYFAYGNLGVRYEDGHTVQDPFWGQNDGVPNGRLNEVGIWGCIPGTEEAGHDPVGEWVGFQVCLELAETGTYVVGMGADNRFKLVVNDVEMWREDTGATSAFNYWWMVNMGLEAGEHIVQLWGKNDGSIAGLGVEIYGPFDPALVSDGPSTHALPLADNIVWSTLETVGHSFEIGGEVGWYCPDGAVVDFCEDEPMCLVYEEMPCP